MLTLYSIEVFTIIVASFFLTACLLFGFKLYVKKLNLFIAEPNFRSSHKHPTPTGAGLVIALIYIGVLFYLTSFNEVFSIDMLKEICFGAIIATLFGFYDDLKDASTKSKLALQIFLGLWILFIFFHPISLIISNYSMLFIWIFMISTLFLLVWFSNAINFMDGINGMLASGVVNIMFSASILIFLLDGNTENILLLLLLLSVSIAFLFFNFPVASIFMGDSGSLYFAYIICCLALKTIFDGDLSIWTWLILLGHLLIEPTITTLMRIYLSKNWYKSHRNCAYQNIARELDSHTKVTLGAIIFHNIWLFPLAIISIYFVSLGPILYILSIIPVIAFTINYGPLYSND